MAETLGLTTPEVTPPITNAGYKIAAIHLLVVPTADVSVHLVGDNGERIEVRTADTTEAQTLLQQLNTANLSTKSLQRRCLEWCASKLPKLAGTVTGTPS
jgi:hypothetical protein